MVRSEIIKGSVCFIAGDNLGSHGIGGFNENFSTVDYFCRYCTVTSKDFHSDPLKTSSERNSLNYNEALSILSRDDSLHSVSGIKFDSISILWNTFMLLKLIQACPHVLHMIFLRALDHLMQQ